jgi:UrcA family protein
MKIQSIAAQWSRAAAFGLALCVSGAVLSTAHAGTTTNANGERELVVKYGDLNLANPEGVSVLYKRLRVAAVRVCENDSPYLEKRAEVKRCIADAMERAVARVNSPALTAYAASKGGERRPS